MEAKELRIGNFVRLDIFCHDHEEDYCKITGITEEDVFVNIMTFDYLEFQEIKPILLDEKWLKFFGFERSNSGNRHYWSRNEIGGNLVNGGYKFHTCTEQTKRCNYVHQLQNLYFALTGEELTTNNSTQE